jgi:hypothetical protein
MHVKKKPNIWTGLFSRPGRMLPLDTRWIADRMWGLS